MSKGAKETIVTRLGFKSSSSASKAEAELEKVRKENAHLRKKIDELAKRHIKPPDSDKSKLLEVNKCLFVRCIEGFNFRNLFMSLYLFPLFCILMFTYFLHVIPEDPVP